MKEYVGLKYNNGWIVDEKINNIEELSIYDNTLRDVLKKNKGKNVKQEIPYDLVSIISVDESRGGDLIPTGSNATYSMVKKGLVKYEKKPKVVAGYEFEFSNLYNLCDAMTIKADLGQRTRKIYNSRDMEQLDGLIDDYTKFLEKLNLFYYSFRKQWYIENKPNGFEIQDIRIGGLIKRT